ncbi:MAG: SLC13 family permease, partial [Planctomycetota bacterium]|nr:SLC13 family permease [Planctomycetota bacterium]
MRRWYPVLQIAVFFLACLAVTTATSAKTDAATTQETDTPAAVLDSQDSGNEPSPSDATSTRTAQTSEVSSDAEDSSTESEPQSSDTESSEESDLNPTGASFTSDSESLASVILLAVGIVCVLGMIIILRLNAFLALIISALIVSLGVGWTQGESAGDRMNAVVQSFGSSAGSIGIVIAMAAIIGKCMLDSGAADRIVRNAVDVVGEKKASLGLMISGFVLAIPVFFDTVFYLLVPLARSLHRRTNKSYLRYLMAIATGGAIT